MNKYFVRLLVDGAEVTRYEWASSALDAAQMANLNVIGASQISPRTMKFVSIGPPPEEIREAEARLMTQLDAVATRLMSKLRSAPADIVRGRRS